MTAPPNARPVVAVTEVKIARQLLEDAGERLEVGPFLERALIAADEQPWTRDYLEEMKEYNGVGTDVHDDQVDVTWHAWNELYRPALLYEGEMVTSGCRRQAGGPAKSRQSWKQRDTITHGSSSARCSMTPEAREAAMRLLEKARAALPRLESLLVQADRLSGREAALGLVTQEIITELRALAPDRPLNRRFAETIQDIQSDDWAEGSMPSGRPVRPVVNAFLQARFFLNLAIHCAKAESSRLLLDGPALPSGTVALLRLYEL
jgi:hypothetical protein